MTHPQTITIDLDAASSADDQAPGRVCHGCLQRTVDAERHYWVSRKEGVGQRICAFGVTAGGDLLKPPLSCAIM